MFRKQKSFCRFLVFLTISLCLLALTACGLNKIIPADHADAVPTANAYRKAVIHAFEADQDLLKKNPNAAILCENAAFQELLKIGTIPMIVKTASSSTLRESDTIIIKVRLTSAREIKQMPGKTKASAGVMTAHVRLIDASTGKTVHDQYVPLANQPSIKSTEDPSELGKLIALHVSRMIQSK